MKLSKPTPPKLLIWLSIFICPFTSLASHEPTSPPTNSTSCECPEKKPDYTIDGTHGFLIVRILTLTPGIQVQYKQNAIVIQDTNPECTHSKYNCIGPGTKITLELMYNGCPMETFFPFHSYMISGMINEQNVMQLGHCDTLVQVGKNDPEKPNCWEEVPPYVEPEKCPPDSQETSYSYFPEEKACKPLMCNPSKSKNRWDFDNNKNHDLNKVAFTCAKDCKAEFIYWPQAEPTQKYPNGSEKQEKVSLTSRNIKPQREDTEDFIGTPVPKINEDPPPQNQRNKPQAYSQPNHYDKDDDYPDYDYLPPTAAFYSSLYHPYNSPQMKASVATASASTLLPSGIGSSASAAASGQAKSQNDYLDDYGGEYSNQDSNNLNHQYMYKQHYDKHYPNNNQNSGSTDYASKTSGSSSMEYGNEESGQDAEYESNYEYGNEQSNGQYANDPNYVYNENFDKHYPNVDEKQLKGYSLPTYATAIANAETKAPTSGSGSSHASAKSDAAAKSERRKKIPGGSSYEYSQSSASAKASSSSSRYETNDQLRQYSLFPSKNINPNYIYNRHHNKQYPNVDIIQGEDAFDQFERYASTSANTNAFAETRPPTSGSGSTQASASANAAAKSEERKKIPGGSSHKFSESSSSSSASSSSSRYENKLSQYSLFPEKNLDPNYLYKEHYQRHYPNTKGTGNQVFSDTNSMNRFVNANYIYKEHYNKHYPNSNRKIKPEFEQLAGEIVPVLSNPSAIANVRPDKWVLNKLNISPAKSFSHYPYNATKWPDASYIYNEHYAKHYPNTRSGQLATYSDQRERDIYKAGKLDPSKILAGQNIGMGTSSSSEPGPTSTATSQGTSSSVPGQTPDASGQGRSTSGSDTGNIPTTQGTGQVPITTGQGTSTTGGQGLAKTGKRTATTGGQGSTKTRQGTGTGGGTSATRSGQAVSLGGLTNGNGQRPSSSSYLQRYSSPMTSATADATAKTYIPKHITGSGSSHASAEADAAARYENSKSGPEGSFYESSSSSASAKASSSSSWSSSDDGVREYSGNGVLTNYPAGTRMTKDSVGNVIFTNPTTGEVLGTYPPGTNMRTDPITGKVSVHHRSRPSYSSSYPSNSNGQYYRDPRTGRYVGVQSYMDPRTGHRQPNRSHRYYRDPRTGQIVSGQKAPHRYPALHEISTHPTTGHVIVKDPTTGKAVPHPPGSRVTKHPTTGETIIEEQTSSSSYPSSGQPSTGHQGGYPYSSGTSASSPSSSGDSLNYPPSPDATEVAANDPSKYDDYKDDGTSNNDDGDDKDDKDDKKKEGDEEKQDADEDEHEEDDKKKEDADEDEREEDDKKKEDADEDELEEDDEEKQDADEDELEEDDESKDKKEDEKNDKGDEREEEAGDNEKEEEKTEEDDSDGEDGRDDDSLGSKDEADVNVNIKQRRIRKRIGSRKGSRKRKLRKRKGKKGTGRPKSRKLSSSLDDNDLNKRANRIIRLIKERLSKEGYEY